MRLLIITQRVDANDPVLGFFHRWIEEFAKHCTRVTVIGQSVGVHAFSGNVRVVSLCKEDGLPRPFQIVRFWWMLLRLRHQYDAAFVHMTPVWVLIGWPLWRCMRISVFLWYEVRRGGRMLAAALRCVHRVFTATQRGLPVPSSRQLVVGHGIDTERFSPSSEAHDASLVAAVGRLTQVKRYDVILRCFATLPSAMHLRIAGDTITEADCIERERIDRLLSELRIADRVTIGWVPPSDLPDLLRRATLFLHAAEGGLDKAVLQAMACGCIVVSSSSATRDILPDMCAAEPGTMEEQARTLLTMPAGDREQLGKRLRQIVERNHSLPRLIERLVEEMKEIES